MIYILFGIMALLVITLGYAAFNLLRKVERYEATIEKYYTNTTTILRTSRELDSMQMFEKDDEVGSLFQQLITTIGDLRSVVYEDVYVNKQSPPEEYESE
jgi:ABC-type uncharacterized transport system permease subunit